MAGKTNFGYASIWADSLDCYVYVTGLMFFERIDETRDRVEKKIESCKAMRIVPKPDGGFTSAGSHEL